MEIDWEASKNSKALRKTLLAVYPNRIDLEMFVADELDKNLDEITDEGNLTKDAFKLVKWCKAQGRLEELVQAFCQLNEHNPIVVNLQRQLNSNFLSSVQQDTTLVDTDWETLFLHFTDANGPEVCRAFRDAFKSVFNHSFQKIYPKTPLQDLTQVCARLEHHDDPDLAVRFVDRAIMKIKDSGDTTPTQLTALQTWRDRIATTHNVKTEEPELASSVKRQGYLLISLQPSRKKSRQKGFFVSIFSELHVTGATDPVDFNWMPTTCPLNEAAEQVSALIHQAEQAIADDIILELFLPCIHLEEDVAAWEVRNEQAALRPLGKHRRLMIRSFDRANNPKTKARLSQKWQLLKTCVDTKTACEQFHLQEHCPMPSDLEAYLEGLPGLKLCADLPLESKERQAILFDIINSAVPIALWFGSDSCFSATERHTEFDRLLQASSLTDFSDLAQQLRSLRTNPENAEWKHLKLLCDCPDRWPRLPDPSQDDDLLVAL